MEMEHGMKGMRECCRRIEGTGSHSETLMTHFVPLHMKSHCEFEPTNQKVRDHKLKMKPNINTTTNQINHSCMVFDMGLATIPGCFMSTILSPFAYDGSIMTFVRRHKKERLITCGNSLATFSFPEENITCGNTFINFSILLPVTLFVLTSLRRFMCSYAIILT
ncbi:uncharacterized protein HKW66_Vig0152620 [Vigna angularis]|uniref:Uncharacterized protein n=1 Tax=Phaseolus angularis TaxID=3914 RepID=A0A8T0JUF9_PHAAN|nr:uncharacterized protein HKW66_Vig0152620 [Vigna angularis]